MSTIRATPGVGGSVDGVDVLSATLRGITGVGGSFTDLGDAATLVYPKKTADGRFVMTTIDNGLRFSKTAGGRFQLDDAGDLVGWIIQGRFVLRSEP